MAIRKTIKLNWKGDQYQTLITMDMIDRLEDHINLARMAGECATGDIRFSKVAFLMTLLLNEAGAKVNREEVFQSMFGGGDVSVHDVTDLLGQIFAAIFPEPKKKVESPKPKRKASTSKKKATRGTKSTK